MLCLSRISANTTSNWLAERIAIEDGKDEEEALVEGAKRVIAFRNTYRARAHQGVWTIKKPYRVVSSGVLVGACR